MTQKDDNNTAMNGASLNISEQRRRDLKQLFPAAFSETRNDAGELVESIDFERLKAELGEFSEIYDNRRERYGMDWPGKRDCLRLIQQPSYATLKPCREESVDFDSTENLFIEGDNLEVLKLLQKSYYGQVKMIYIDPPYNTGKEFIYPDNYSESLDTYLQYAGLKDAAGRTFSTNTANEGRFHTKWLNMMYPRLYLARNLLREDGVIFISIDDNEVENLRRMCDEIFGEENFVSLITRLTGTPTGLGNANMVSEADYLLLYSRSTNPYIKGLPLTKEDEKIYDMEDAKGRYLIRPLRKTGGEDRKEDRPSMHYEIEAPDGKKIIPIGPEGYLSRWRCSFKRFIKLSEDGMIEWKESISAPNGWKVYQKFYLDGRLKQISNVWNGIEGNKKATRDLKKLLGEKVFDFPKPLELITRCIEISCEPCDIVLDFFSGSGVIGHAVYAVDIPIKFIAVQLPEKCDPGSMAFESGYRTIAEIAKDRIRRAGAEMRLKYEGQLKLEEVESDLGFKVLKLNQSNFKPWQSPDKRISDDELLQQMELAVDHIDPNASAEDLLYELLLKAGVKPTETIERIELAGHNLFRVGEDSLFIHLENDIDQALIDAVLAANPDEFICLDRAFHGNDQLKANAAKTFETYNQGKEGLDRIEFKTV